MGKKVIINESTMKRIVAEEILSKSNVKDLLSNPDFEKKVKEIVGKDKDTEKKIKELVAKCVNKLFYTLWQRNQFWTDTIKNS